MDGNPFKALDYRLSALSACRSTRAAGHMPGGAPVFCENWKKANLLRQFTLRKPMIFRRKIVLLRSEGRAVRAQGPGMCR